MNTLNYFWNAADVILGAIADEDSAQRRKPMKKIKLLSLALILLCGFLPAQTAVVLAPVPQLQFFTQSGVPLAFGCVFTYQTNSVTPLGTYTDNTGVTLNQNPVILSAGGSANIWLQAGQAYSFRIASQGGSNCSAGQTLYTVNGIGGGSSYLTTVVPYSATPTFMVSAQVELFTMTLTGNASANPFTFVGITPPSIIFLQITQDGVGGHTFSYPANSVGGCTVGSGANVTTTVEFVYNGTNATALPCSIGSGSSVSVGTLTATTAIIDDGTLTVTGLSLLNGGFGCVEGSAPSGITGDDLFWCSSSSHRFNMINDNGSSDTVVGAATTDAFTNKTFNTAATGNTLEINGQTVTAYTGTGATVALSASPALTGTPTAPTASPGTNTTQVATTAFVTAVAGNSIVALSSGQVLQSGTITPCNSPSCSATFSHTFTGSPTCVATGHGGSVDINALSTTTITLDSSSLSAASWQCIGPF